MNLTPPTLEQLRALAPGYLFETLAAGERTRFAHALRSPEFGAAVQAERAALQTATGALAASHAITPPTGLRDRLQARIAAEQSASASFTPLPDVSMRCRPQRGKNRSSSPEATRSARPANKHSPPCWRDVAMSCS
ncbi:MAG: hypothetical protein HEQ38_06610 [Gemmatimonas sp.]|nr:hypothetical protein [Gemmatimonas sp.]